MGPSTLNLQSMLAHKPPSLLQGNRRQSFWERHPTLTQAPASLSQLLTLALIIDGAHTIEDKDIDSFLAFLDIQYLPYLMRERDCDPLSPLSLWSHMGDQNNKEPVTPTAVKIACDCRQMLNDHDQSADDLTFKEFLTRNCQFLAELCRKPANQDANSARTTNLELQLVLVDRALETRSKTSASKKEVGMKMEDKFKVELVEKLSELLRSVKSVIDVVANGDLMLASNSLDQSNKKMKQAAG